MLETIIVVLLALWLLGMVGSYTAGGLLHVLIVVVAVLVILRFLQGRRL